MHVIKPKNSIRHQRERGVGVLKVTLQENKLVSSSSLGIWSLKCNFYGEKRKEKSQKSNPMGVHSQALGIDSLEKKLRGVHYKP
jgi:hypothetical protein